MLSLPLLPTSKPFSNSDEAGISISYLPEMFVSLLFFKEHWKKSLLFIVPLQTLMKAKVLLLQCIFICWCHSPHSTCLIVSPFLSPGILAAFETITVVFRVQDLTHILYVACTFSLLFMAEYYSIVHIYLSHFVDPFIH